MFKKVETIAFLEHFKGFHIGCSKVMLCNSFSLKHLSMTNSNFSTCCGQSLAELCLFTEVRNKISKNQSAVKPLLNIVRSVKTE